MRPMFILLFCFLAVPAMQTLIAEEGRLTTEPGVELYWRAAGDGPVVIVPGGFLFHEDLDRLARSHRLILYDMRNRGRSAAVRDPELLTIDGDVRDLEAIRAHFQVESFSAIGYSYLGKMIVLYALKHPERIDRLVQIGPVPMRFGSLMPPVWDNTAEQVMDPDAVARLRKLRAEGVHEERPREYCEEEWLVTRVRLVGDPALAARLESWCSLPNEWPTRFADHLRHHFPSAQRANVSPLALARFDKPVLTIHGTRDRNAPYGGGREWAAMLPNGRLRTVAGGAHQAWLDDPSVLDDLERFLGGAWPETAVDLDIAREEWLSQLRGVGLLETVVRASRRSDADGPIDLRLEGATFERSQSKSTRPPYDRFPVVEEVVFNAGGTEVVVDQELHWPNSVSRYRTMSRPGDGFELNLNARRVVEPFMPPRTVWLRQIMMAPPYLAEQVLEAPQSIRLIGLDTSEDEAYQMVEANLGDERLTLRIDRDDRIRGVSRLAYGSMTGDGLEETWLAGDQIVNGLVFPQSVRRSLNGELMAEMVIVPGAGADLSRFEIPDDFERASDQREAPGLELERLAPDVWRVRNIGGADYQSLVVVHDDGLVVVETPLREEAMDAVIERLREQFDGMPIKAAVVTHHHFDHSGGVRSLMKSGVRIYVPRGTERFFRSVATAPRTLRRGSEGIDPSTLRIEGVQHGVIEPESRGPAVHLHSVGENVHAEGILFVWVPERKILFQGDLYVKGGGEVEPARPQGVTFLRKIEEMGLDPESIVGAHGRVATLEDLQRSVAAAGN